MKVQNKHHEYCSKNGEIPLGFTSWNFIVLATILVVFIPKFHTHLWYYWLIPYLLSLWFPLAYVICNVKNNKRCMLHGGSPAKLLAFLPASYVREFFISFVNFYSASYVSIVVQVMRTHLQGGWCLHQGKQVSFHCNIQLNFSNKSIWMVR